MPKKNKSFRLLTLGAAVLVIGGGIAAYALLLQRRPVPRNAPMGTQLVPQDALVTASISTTSAQWQQLRQYGTPETKAALDKELTQLHAELLSANGYNYEKDIQPWLGETVTVAYLKSGRSVAGATQEKKSASGIPFLKLPDLIVLPIENPDRAKQLLENTQSQKVTEFAERTYKGIQIRETQKSDSQNYAAAVLGNFFVVANNPETINRVIDTYKGEASVAATPGYVEKLGKINASNPFARLYLNMPVIAAVAATHSKRSHSPDDVAAKQQRQGIATTVTLEPEGLRFQSISWLKPNSEQKYRVQNQTSRLPRRLPANTLLAISGGNLAQLWRDYAQGAETNLLNSTLLSPANLGAGLQAISGLDVEDDLLPWMEDEFALALIPASDDLLVLPETQPAPTLGAGVVLMVLSSDRTSTEKSFEQLDQVMESRYQFAVEETQLNNQPVVSWISPLGGVSATHGWLEGNVAFLTFGSPIADAIVPQPQATLTQTPLFQQTVPTQPKPNNGQFFLDVDRTINRGNLNLQLSPTWKMWLQAIRTLGVTAAINDERSTRFDVFVQLKKTLTPSASETPNSAEASPSPSPSDIEISPSPSP